MTEPSDDYINQQVLDLQLGCNLGNPQPGQEDDSLAVADQPLANEQPGDCTSDICKLENKSVDGADSELLGSESRVRIRMNHES